MAKWLGMGQSGGKNFKNVKVAQNWFKLKSGNRMGNRTKKSNQNPSRWFFRFRTGLSTLEVIGDLDGTLGVSPLLRIGRIRKHVTIPSSIQHYLYCRCSPKGSPPKGMIQNLKSPIHFWASYRDSMSAKDPLKSYLH